LIECDVLVVDDDAATRAYTSSVLQELGWVVSVASSGRQALELVRKERPTLVILGSVIPDMSGEDVCQAIKNDPTFQDMLVMVLSAKNDIDTKLQYFQAGADEYLVKPIDARELVARVNAFLRIAVRWKSSGVEVPEGRPSEEMPAPIREENDDGARQKAQESEKLIVGTIRIKRSPDFEQLLMGMQLSREQSFLALRMEEEPVSVETLSMLTGLSGQQVAETLLLLRDAGAISWSPGEEADRESLHAPARREVVPDRRQALSSETSGLNLDAVRMEVRKSDKELELGRVSSDAEQLYNLAEKKFAEGDYYKVIDCCRRAIATNPADGRYYVLAARAFAKNSRSLKEAQVHYEKACEQAPWDPDYRLELAQFYLQQGLRHRALAECQKALEIAPGLSHADALLKRIKKQK
jgi:DNA-binding response OmpR family regulator